MKERIVITNARGFHSAALEHAVQSVELSFTNSTKFASNPKLQSPKNHPNGPNRQAQFRTINEPDWTRRTVMPITHHDTDPFDTLEYHAFVDSMSQHCYCTSAYNPCDSVLAGAPCDRPKPFDSDDDLLTIDDDF